MARHAIAQERAHERADEPYSRMASERSRATGAWWHAALADFSVSAHDRLRKAYPSIRAVHDDLVGDAVLNLTQHLKRRPVELPSRWFEPGDPCQRDIERFQQLAFTVLNRRIADHFRNHYRRWLDHIDPQPTDAQLSGDDAGTALDLRRVARAISAAMDLLPEADRALLREVALGGADGPMTVRDRQRLRRLRSKLLESLRATLKEDPIDLIRRR
jgi:hypothetical protein